MRQLKRVAKRFITISTSDLAYGLLWIIITGLIFFWIAGNPFDELKFIYHSKTAPGYIYDADEEVERGDNGQDASRHWVLYKYTLPNGRKLEGGYSASGRLSEDLVLPERIKVEYLQDNPTESRIKGNGAQSLGEWLWRKIAIGGALFLFIVIYPAIKIVRGDFDN